MRRRLFRGVVAATLAVAVMLPGTISPAHAETPADSPASTQDLAADILKWINIAKTAYDLIRGILGGGGPSIADAIQQINAKIDEAKAEILAHIDAIATAEARACARHHVIEFADVNLFNADVLQRWAQDATGCATLIDSLIDTVADKAQSDQLGLALNVAGPIALAARVKAGFSTVLLTETLRHGNNAVVSKLFPTCQQWSVREPATPIVEVFYGCTAYNGDYAEDSQIFNRGRPIGAPISKPAVQNQSTARTSRAVAQSVLPSLQF
jgi:hypothetical protein